MSRTLAAVATELDAQFIGDDMSFHQVSIDSRKLRDGALFVAIEGEHFDSVENPQGRQVACQHQTEAVDEDPNGWIGFEVDIHLAPTANNRESSLENQYAGRNRRFDMAHEQTRW